MHKEHSVFKKPEDENIKIWRYIDFSKFIELIDIHTLFFTTVDRLDDKFEGSYSKYIYDPSFEEQATAEQRQEIKKLRETFVGYNKRLRKMTFVNCWHMNEFESAAMWKLYLKSIEGVAIQSTYRRLADSFNEYDENDVYIGTVNYIDYGNQPVPISTKQNPILNAFYPFLYKRKSFEHERELRAVITHDPSFHSRIYQELEIPEPKVKAEVSAFGLSVPVDLETLVERVFVSPTAEKWFENLVRSVMKKYSFDKPVIKSSLADDPII